MGVQLALPAFAAGRDACGRAWGQDAPARPGESRWRVGPGFGWGLAGWKNQGLWLGLLPVAHGVPSYQGLAGKLEALGADRYRLSQQAGMPAVGLGGGMPLQDRAKVGGGWGRVLAGGLAGWKNQGLWLGLLPVAHGVPSYQGLAMNLLRVRHQPVPGFAAGRDACGRAWGQDAPARPGESRWRVGPGCDWGLAGWKNRGLWLGLLPVAHGVPLNRGD